MTDSLLNREEVRRLLVAGCIQAGGQGRWAQQHGVAPSYVSEVLNGRRAPGYGILSALGLERVIAYRARDPNPGE